MNYIKTLTILFAFGCMSPAVWAQTKALPKLPKAVSTKQLLEQTRAFIERNHRRPKNMIYQNGVRLRLWEMTPPQQQEVRLGQAISNTFTRARKQGEDIRFNPDLYLLRQLLEASPNLQKQGPTAAELLTQLRAYIQTHQARPRSIIYMPNNSLYKNIYEMTPQEQAEVRLAHQIQDLFNRVQHHKKPNTPDVQTLAALWKESSRKHAVLSAQELYVQLQTYLHQFGRYPRSLIVKNNIPVPTGKLTPQQHQEVTLARRIRQVLKDATAPAEDIARLANLWQRQSVPTQAELFEQLQQWSAQHNGTRPRRNIYKNGVMLSVEQLKQIPGAYEEYTLAQRFFNALEKGIEDRQLRSKFLEFRNLSVFNPSQITPENQQP